MSWGQALKAWNSHRKTIDPAHVWAMPRKGTPEHQQVLSVQQGTFQKRVEAITKARAAGKEIIAKVERGIEMYRDFAKKSPEPTAPKRHDIYSMEEGEKVKVKSVLELWNDYLSDLEPRAKKAATEKALYYTGKGAGGKAGHAMSLDDARKVVMGILDAPARKRGRPGGAKNKAVVQQTQDTYTQEMLEGMKFPEILGIVRARKYKGHTGLRREGMIRFLLERQGAPPATLTESQVEGVQEDTDSDMPMVPSAAPEMPATPGPVEPPRVELSLASPLVGVGRAIPTAEPKHLSRPVVENPMFAVRGSIV